MSTVKTRGAKGAREPREPKLGVLGGMGPQATQVFYQYVLDRTEASLRPGASARPDPV